MWDPARKALGAAAVILDEQGRSMDRGGHSGVVVAAQLVAVFLAMVACGPAPVTPEPAADPTVVLPAAPTAVGATASPSQLMAPRSRTAGYDTAKIRRWAARPGEWSPPELLQLVRVLPIAQSVAHDGVELTALSLEA